MNILIKQARVFAQNSPFHTKRTDILIEGGLIREIGKNITKKTGTKIIEGDGLCVSAGWIDLQVISCDPGYEHRETVDSLLAAAAAGGFTGVCVHSHNKPALSTKAQIEYLLHRSAGKVTRLFPFGTITVDGKGKDLAEMFDMKQSGAPAFSDYKTPLQDAGTLLRALQYASNIGSLVVAHVCEQSVAHGGQMNEGEIAVSLGLKGIPALAEELMLQRNLSVLDYTGGRMHVPLISTRGSVELIRKAKGTGLQVSCGVAASHLLLDDSALSGFDTNYKTDPPLRSKKDVQALRNAVLNGVIDVIVSDHCPQDTESKDLEFDLADAGMIGVQSAFSCALEALGDKGAEALVKALSENPRAVLGLPQPKLEAGEKADLTVFSLQDTTTFSETGNLSLSSNSPFFGRKLPGRVYAVVNGSRHYMS